MNQKTTITLNAPVVTHRILEAVIELKDGKTDKGELTAQAVEKTYGSLPELLRKVSAKKLKEADKATSV